MLFFTFKFQYPYKLVCCYKMWKMGNKRPERRGERAREREREVTKGRSFIQHEAREAESKVEATESRRLLLFRFSTIFDGFRSLLKASGIRLRVSSILFSFRACDSEWFWRRGSDLSKQQGTRSGCRRCWSSRRRSRSTPASWARRDPQPRPPAPPQQTPTRSRSPLTAADPPDPATPPLAPALSVH